MILHVIAENQARCRSEVCPHVCEDGTVILEVTEAKDDEVLCKALAWELLFLGCGVLKRPRPKGLAKCGPEIRAFGHGWADLGSKD